MTRFSRKLFCFFSVCLLTYFIFIIPAFTVYAQSVVEKTPVAEGPLQRINEYFSTQTITYSDGTVLSRDVINGPPKPPPGYELERSAVSLPESDEMMATGTLTVPAFDWVFGCSSVSGAMIAGYYDRNGYPNMYTGPANGGVMPLNNSTTYWPTWSDGYTTYPNLPLAASHNGVDGRVTRGSIDDYWVQYGSSTSDPYITGSWTQHTWSDAIGDYMKTSQSSYGNTDGSTNFWSYTSSASQLTCTYMETHSSGGHTLSWNDGTYGRKLFYEAKGYTDCYNQKTDNVIAGGFSFAQYKAEIDAGRPVMLNLEGHTIVGVAYDDSGNTVYIHDTWDYSDHTMTWGGSYSGRQLLSVSIVNLQAPPPVSSLYADFGSNGIWMYNGSTWSQVTPYSPTAMVASGSLLYGKYDNGIWQYNGSTWTQLTPYSPSAMVAAGSLLYGKYDNGIWQYSGSTWTQLTPYSPTDMVAAGNLLYGKYDNGIWQYSGSTWTQLTPYSPTAMVATGSLLYANYDNGIWLYNGSTWSQVTPYGPTAMVATGSLLYANYDNGIWLYNGSTWSQVTPNNPEAMVATGSLLYADFGSTGIWMYNGSTWSQITPNNPTTMIVP